MQKLEFCTETELMNPTLELEDFLGRPLSDEERFVLGLNDELDEVEVDFDEQNSIEI